MSRPSAYTKELAEAICFEIASTAKGIKTICEENADFPCFKTVFNWLNDPDKEEFLQLYARAREMKADMLFDEIVEIADTTKEGTKTKTLPDGKKETTTGDMVERSRLQMEARKFSTARLEPTKYGEKLSVKQQIKSTNVNYNAELTAEEIKKIDKELEDEC